MFAITLKISEFQLCVILENFSANANHVVDLTPAELTGLMEFASRVNDTPNDKVQQSALGELREVSSSSLFNS